MSGSIGEIKVSAGFSFAPQDAKLKGESAAANVRESAPPPSKSVILSAFKGVYKGTGFNTIFRPNGTGKFHTTLDGPIDASSKLNVLELNLISETLSFSPPSRLGNVPNRGLDKQSDITLVGVPYLQEINDVTNVVTGKGDSPAGPDNGIHFEPGLWMVVPSTENNPVLPQTLNRMASIPHGTTINAQGLEPPKVFPGGPKFAVVDITPKTLTDQSPIVFPSQTASDNVVSRLPQDLTKFIKAGTITQAILSDPNTVLRNHIKNQTIIDTTVFQVSTDPNDRFNPSDPKIPGSGTANQAFLVGTDGTTANAPNANANAAKMNAIFWVETVSWKVTVPVSKKGANLVLKPQAPNPDVPLPQFSVTTPKDVSKAFDVTVTSTQIQYSQMVFLTFDGLSWPHSSVATLAPADPIPIDPSVFH